MGFWAADAGRYRKRKKPTREGAAVEDEFTANERRGPNYFRKLRIRERREFMKPGISGSCFSAAPLSSRASKGWLLCKFSEF